MEKHYGQPYNNKLWKQNKHKSIQTNERIYKTMGEKNDDAISVKVSTLINKFLIVASWLELGSCVYFISTGFSICLSSLR